MGIFDYEPSTHPFTRTRTGTKLHYGHCESLYNFAVSNSVKRDAQPMTQQQAADWLAADPRRSLCGRCSPPTPHGRLRVVR